MMMSEEKPLAEVDRTYRTVTFQTSVGTHVAISISADWLWNYLKDFHYVLSLQPLKECVIPKIIEFCYHYLDEPMMEIPHIDENHIARGCFIHSLVQPWYASFLHQLQHHEALKGELLIASRILHIQPLEDLIGVTLPFPHQKYSLGELRCILEAGKTSNSRRQKRKMDGDCCGGSRKR